MKLGMIYALLSAFLFGASTPFIKMVATDGMSPILIAGILYFGYGIGMSLILIFWKLSNKIRDHAPIEKSDRKWLYLAILFGGIIAPILLMAAIQLIPASNVSLLLNLEGVLTSLLAWFIFKENFDRRILFGMIAIMLGGIILSLDKASSYNFSIGALCVVSACFFWGLDSNFTRKISASDPIKITAIKGVVAGAINLIIGYLLVSEVPNLPGILQISAIGFFGYGVSLVFFIQALQLLGTARTSAYFGTAPFIGVLISIIAFNEEFTLAILASAILMGIGVWIHMTEKHEHQHVHEELEHDHKHIHDEHHQHEHDFNWDGKEPHSHNHKHKKLAHSHKHFPDIHHRHSH